MTSFDEVREVWHRWRMRRLLALFVLIAFVAATAAPAIAACRMNAPKDCCCTPARANTICAPDCCDMAKPAAPAVDLTTRLRTVVPVASDAFAIAVVALLAPSPFRISARAARSHVSVHERAAPRLPLRI